MTSRWFSAFALLAALLVGYGVISQRDTDGIDSLPAPILAGYYLKNAVITETATDGAPRIRLAAVTVQQDPKDNAVQMTDVKADYHTIATTDQPSTHWEMRATNGRMPAKSDWVMLSGKVTANTVDAARNVTFATPTLNIDTKQQLANTDDDVAIDVGGHRITGQGLKADLPHESMYLSGHGVVQLAANDAHASIVKDDNTKISLPGIFDHEGLELRDGGIRLIKVRSKTEPLVQADEATATNTELDNNRFTLTGNVSMELPQQGKVFADTAVVAIRNSRIVHAIATGKPVRFEHQRQTQDKNTHQMTVETARGRAKKIDYDVLTNMVVFTGDVFFSTGRFEWRGEEWRYNLTDGSGSTTSRSTTTVLPQPDANSNKSSVPSP